jgi:tol-pal system beta propeller repeat protein TolB
MHNKNTQIIHKMMENMKKHDHSYGYGVFTALGALRNPKIFKALKAFALIFAVTFATIFALAFAPNAPFGLVNSELQAANIRLSGGRIEPVRILLIADHKVGSKWQSIVYNDLQNSDYFIVQKGQVADLESFDPNNPESFKKWEKYGVSGVVILREGAKKAVGNKNQQIQTEIYALPTRTLRMQKDFRMRSARGKTYDRYDAHVIADAVFQMFIGEKSNFVSKIAYVATAKSVKDHKKRLSVMDIDGGNPIFISDGRINVSRPVLSPDGALCAYLAMRNYEWKIYVFDFKTHQHRPLKIPGNSFAHSFSRDKRFITFSHYLDGGNAEIAIYDLNTDRFSYVTKHSAIDTSPAFSPDGRKIVFESARQNGQQLYIKDLDTNQVKRISFGPGQYAAPSWSPRGDYIAFTRIYQGEFYIGVVRPDGSGEKILSKSFMVENPAFSPNGREIMYYRQTRQNRKGQHHSRLYAVDLLTGKTRLVRTITNAEDPSWAMLYAR